MASVLPKDPPMNLKSSLEASLSKDFDTDRLVDHIPARMLLVAKHVKNVEEHFGSLGAEARMLMFMSRRNILEPDVFFEILKLVDHVQVCVDGLQEVIPFASSNDATAALGKAITHVNILYDLILSVVDDMFADSIPFSETPPPVYNGDEN